MYMYTSSGFSPHMDYLSIMHCYFPIPQVTIFFFFYLLALFLYNRKGSWSLNSMLFVIGSIILFMFNLFIMKKALVGVVDLKRNANCATFFNLMSGRVCKVQGLKAFCSKSSYMNATIKIEKVLFKNSKLCIDKSKSTLSHPLVNNWIFIEIHMK